MSPLDAIKKRYDWKACAFAVVVGMAVAVPAGLAVASLYESTKPPARLTTSRNCISIPIHLDFDRQ